MMYLFIILSAILAVYFYICSNIHKLVYKLNYIRDKKYNNINYII
jgi:hypothetical protein